MDKNELTQRLYGGDAKNVIQELYEATEAYLKTHPKAYKVRNAKETFFANLASFNRLKQQEGQGIITQEQARTQETRILINIKNTIDDLDSAFFDFFSNLSKINEMDLATLTLTAYNIIKPIITSEAGKAITSDLAQAAKGSASEIWQKIKPLFIVEDKETDQLADLKNEPDDKDYEEAFISALKAKLKKDPNLQKEIQAILAKEETQGGGTGSISNSTNASTGNFTNVHGNIVFGDNNQIGK